MRGLWGPLLDLLPLYGPWLVLALAFLETCFLTGVVVPAGVATSAATVLALNGRLPLGRVLVAALVGALAGDAVGFWVGRRAGARYLAGEALAFGGGARRYRRWSRFLSRRPIYSVTVARLVVFVRTLMPMAAGMSGLSYRRFLPFDVAGAAGWVLLYAGIGWAAEESWEVVVRATGLGGGVAFGVVGVVLWRLVGRRVERRLPAESPAPGPGEVER